MRLPALPWLFLDMSQNKSEPSTRGHSGSKQRTEELQEGQPTNSESVEDTRLLAPEHRPSWAAGGEAGLPVNSHWQVTYLRAGGNVSLRQFDLILLSWELEFYFLQDLSRTEGSRGGCWQGCGGEKCLTGPPMAQAHDNTLWAAFFLTSQKSQPRACLQGP